MAATRPLHDVFGSLADESDREPAEVLRAHGHDDLPESLVAEAVVNYADTAPVEVAEHLAPFVMAHSAVPNAGTLAGSDAEPPGWGELLMTAPTGIADGIDPAEHLDIHHGGVGQWESSSTTDPAPAADDPTGLSGDPDDNFGRGDDVMRDDEHSAGDDRDWADSLTEPVFETALPHDGAPTVDPTVNADTDDSDADDDPAGLDLG